VGEFAGTAVVSVTSQASATPSGQPAQRKRIAIESAGLICTIVLVVVGFVVIYPIALLLLKSFDIGALGAKPAFGLANWAAALDEPGLRAAIVNTLTLTAARQAIAFSAGIGLAWLLARTDIPRAYWLEFGFWIAFFLPALTGTLGWILLLDPDYGLVNHFLTSLGVPAFNIFSWWGIVFAHLATGSVAINTLLLVPSFRNLDPSIEEASRMSGARTAGTIFRIVVPVLAPAMFVVLLLGVIRSMEAFEIELILGSPQRINVYSTIIYREIFSAQPQYGVASAMSMIVLFLLMPFIGMQQLLAARRRHATLTGKTNQRPLRLGGWRWPAFAAIAGFLALVTLVPAAMVTLATFMKIFGFFDVPDGAFTLDHWRTALSDHHLIASLYTTVAVAAGAAAIAMAGFSLVAYILARARYRFRAILDFVTWLPSTVPGIVVGLGFLWLFVGTPIFRPLYGTIWIMMIAIAIGGMTTGVQVLKANMIQLGKELEEAARASGANTAQTFRRIVLPLISPAIITIGLLSFAAATKATSLVVLLSTGSLQPLSILQLNYMGDGDYESATVLGVIILVVTVVIALAAQAIGLRSGASGRAMRFKPDAET
jgi:iron(III) transport system permease protein